MRRREFITLLGSRRRHGHSRHKRSSKKVQFGLDLCLLVRLKTPMICR